MSNPLLTPPAPCKERVREFTIQSLPPIPHTCGYAGAFAGVVGDILIAGGGANFPDGTMPWDGGEKVWHDTLHGLDLRTPEAGWTILGKLPQPNGYGVSLTAPEGVLFLGGGNAAENFSTAFLVTLNDHRPHFQHLPGLPHGLAQMSGALVGRAVHLCGGLASPDATTASNAHWQLDLDALENGWQRLPDLPAPGRILATAASCDGAFHLVGGCSLTPNAAGQPVRALLTDAWKFSQGCWIRLANPPHPIVAAGSPAPVAADAIFVVSGDDGSQASLASPADHPGFPKSVLRYDTAHDRWSHAGNLTIPPPVTVPVVPWRGEFLFINGEVAPGVRTPDVFTFHIDTTIPTSPTS
jgi:N-acetylneuraminate epimerase